MAKKPQHPAPAKAVCSRAGTTRDNSAARAFFALPPLALANTTAVTAPAALPVQRNSTSPAIEPGFCFVERYPCRYPRKRAVVGWLPEKAHFAGERVTVAVTPAVTAKAYFLNRCASSWCASRCARNRRLARLWLAAKLAHMHPRGARLKFEPCNPLPERRHWLTDWLTARLTAKAYFLNLKKPEIAAQRWCPAIEHKNSS